MTVLNTRIPYFPRESVKSQEKSGPKLNIQKIGKIYKLAINLWDNTITKLCAIKTCTGNSAISTVLPTLLTKSNNNFPQLFYGQSPCKLLLTGHPDSTCQVKGTQQFLWGHAISLLIMFLRVRKLNYCSNIQWVINCIIFWWGDNLQQE